MSDEFEHRWLSDLPATWTEKRADFLCSRYRVTVNPDRFGDDLVAHYSIPQVQETSGPLIEPASDIDSSKLLIDAPTLLVSKLNPRKKTICIAEPHSEYPTLASGEFVAINSEEMDRHYAYYLWCSEKVTDRLSAIVQSVTRSHQRVNPTDILKLPWKWPPLDTQRRIARFLDEKTARIDALIEKKCELLERLAEKRQALITSAVTKGLSPEAPSRLPDTNARSEGHRAAEGPDGITKLTLPQDWSSKRIKYLATYNDEVLAESTDEEKEIDYVEISGVSLSYGIEEVERLPFGRAPSRARRLVRSGDILISTVRTYLRAIAKVDEATPDLVASTGFCVVRPNDNLDSGFLGWAAKSESFVSEVVARSVGVSYPAINASDLVAIYVPLPPLRTQQRIAQFLDDRTAHIDRLSESIKDSIARLKEYRAAQITAAVTGQFVELR